MKPNQFFLSLLIFALAFAGDFQKLSAESLVGPNYSIENPNFDAGGTQSSSTNYDIKSSFGDNGDAAASSSGYQAQPGFIPGVFPGVPGQPALANTGGSLYNALDFIVATANNPGDVEYAIAISSDNFATTQFIQTDDTVGAGAAWQTYSGWGSGAGERVTGLTASTTYQIKVKARYAPHTETAYSLPASASTASPSFTMTISGVNSGTSVAGQTTTLTTSATGIAYGSLVQDVPSIAAQKITISTNAAGGYATTIQQDGNLRRVGGYEIAPVSGTNASPAAFPLSVSTGAFGYHTTDATLCQGTATRFSADDSYAQATAQPEEVACSAGPVAGEDTYLVFKALIGAQQPAGSYANTLTYISSGKY